MCCRLCVCVCVCACVCVCVCVFTSGKFHVAFELKAQFTPLFHVEIGARVGAYMCACVRVVCTCTHTVQVMHACANTRKECPFQYI